MSIIALSRISKSFGDKTVLHGVDLEVGEGEMVGLIGASGSGKSTLIRMICGLERMDRGTAGRIALFDKETQKDGRFSEHCEGLRREVGVIFQQFNLISRLSLLTNVLAGRLGRIPRWRGTTGLFPQSDKVKALRALERVGLIDQAHQRASTLSGGQQQRGAIARVLTQEARLILADEPIASLDPASAKLVMSTLRQINRLDKTTVIVSLHQIDHAFEHCDRIIALKDGRVLHNGPTGGISPDDIADLYGVEAGSLDLVKARPAKPTGRPAYPGNGLAPQDDLAARVAVSV
ncbi:phosphonate ABC transporter ATP-binding protein [Pelagibius litoralis]|uniref:Phosphonate ABC transporter ATP-binding protein n=1 Tax=Pelagibius litoralis TaxID=374515 RepID=A0A967K9A3_9PROT|nr:phosphonate ABC transporter ATP-binding protein [Pelagibius litoralis]NIA70918.1 phosphonate ABC transporter ATP-binding protein [Pelagibius litoralis]